VTEEAALKALTANAAKLGVGDRLGTIEKGKIVNVIVADGTCSTALELSVFVAGWPVDLDFPRRAPVAAVAAAVSNA
jgi:cytosine/adenosine deaminase-related metal-dependent hydrolase